MSGPLGGAAWLVAPGAQVMGEEARMSTNDIVQQYFEALAQKGTWQSFLADGLRFTSFTSPGKELTGKAAYLETTRRFFSMVVSVELRDLIVQGDKACALTRYQLQAPSGTRFQSDVAEVFTVRQGKIETFGIYFDTAPFPK
jgi:ketosteroid isomerase-like protein